MPADHRGPWLPLSPYEGAALFASCAVEWWIAGGWAIDLLVGHETRTHEDLDVLILRRDQHRIRAHLERWDVYAADPPGTLRPWPIGETLPAAVHDIWCRTDSTSPWSFQLMIDDIDGGDWLFRRDRSIRRPVASLAGRASRAGLPVLAPEILLLYKSKSARSKDVHDLERALPLMTADERAWLREALHAAQPGHPWLARI